VSMDRMESRAVAAVSAEVMAEVDAALRASLAL